MIPASTLVSADALRRWAAQGSDGLNARERVLLSLRWFDWVSSSDLYDAMEIAEDQRNLLSSALCWLVKHGRVEQDRSQWPRMYRLRRDGDGVL